MKLSRTQLAKIISAQTINHGIDKTLGREIAKILLHTDKTNSLDSLMRDVVRNWADSGYVDVIARSAFPLSDKVKTDIKKLIKKYYPNAKQIKIIEEIDPEVVAGVVLEFADKQLDLSVETKLNKFKHFTANARKD
jgi:F-type H+-transporting ATPase subunit O